MYLRARDVRACVGGRGRGGWHGERERWCWDDIDRAHGVQTVQCSAHAPLGLNRQAVILAERQDAVVGILATNKVRLAM